MIKEQNLEIVTPIKKAKGQTRLSAADRLYSELVSRIRQPIESLFGWIEEKNRHSGRLEGPGDLGRGLMVHVFGRFAAAMLLLAFNS